MRDCWGMGQDVARMLLTSDIMCNDSSAECLLVSERNSFTRPARITQLAWIFKGNGYKLRQVSLPNTI